MSVVTTLTKSLSFVLLSAALALTACSKTNSNSDGGGNVAQFALPAECGGPVSSQTGDWDDYQSAGATAYNWDHGHFRHRGCPSNTFAACGNGVGMICVPGDIYREKQIAWFNYTDGANRLQFCGYQSANDTGNCSYRSVAGAGQIGRACIVGERGQCGPGTCASISSFGSHDGRDNRGGRDGRDGHHGHGHAERIGVCVQ